MNKNRHFLIAAAFSLLAAFAPAQAQFPGEDEQGFLTGLLMSGPQYSALIAISPSDTDDIMAFGFKNKSPVGRKILANCLPEIFCRAKIDGTESGEMLEKIQAFELPLSVAFEMTQADDAHMVSNVDNDNPEKLKTRFGLFSVDEEKYLLFKGRRVQPEVQGNASLSLETVFESGAQDIALIQEVGGTACPGTFYYVSVNARGVQKVSPEFGSCSDIFRVYQREDGAILFYTVEYQGAFPEEIKPLRRMDYVYHNGRLTENGKEIKP